MHCDFSNTSTVGVNGRAVYKRFVVWVSQDRYADLNFIPGSDNTIGIDSTKKLDTVFLKVVTTGKNLTLYTYTDFTKQRFFIGEKEKSPTELILHKYLEQEPVLTVVEDKKYRIQLQILRTLYASKNTDLINNIQLADYKESDLAAIVKKLNSN